MSHLTGNQFQICDLKYLFIISVHLQAYGDNTCTGHLRYLKLGCLENPTYIEVISHSRVSLPICYCISTSLVSNSNMTKTRLCRSNNFLPTEKRYLVSPFLCRNYWSDVMISKEEGKRKKQRIKSQFLDLFFFFFQISKLIPSAITKDKDMFLQWILIH